MKKNNWTELPFAMRLVLSIAIAVVLHGLYSIPANLIQS